MVCCPEASANQSKGIKSSCTSHSAVNFAELVSCIHAWSGLNLHNLVKCVKEHRLFSRLIWLKDTIAFSWGCSDSRPNRARAVRSREKKLVVPRYFSFLCTWTALKIHLLLGILMCSLEARLWLMSDSHGLGSLWSLSMPTCLLLFPCVSSSPQGWLRSLWAAASHRRMFIIHEGDNTTRSAKLNLQSEEGPCK